MLDSELRQILDLARRAGVTEIELSNGRLRLRVRRHHRQSPSPGIVEGESKNPADHPDPGDALLVRSPMVGYFYFGARPGERACCAPGDVVEPGTRVGYVEAMGTLTDVLARVGGIAQGYLVAEGNPVEYGQPVLRLSPTRPANGVSEERP